MRWASKIFFLQASVRTRRKLTLLFPWPSRASGTASEIWHFAFRTNTKWAYDNTRVRKILPFVCNGQWLKSRGSSSSPLRNACQVHRIQTPERNHKFHFPSPPSFHKMRFSLAVSGPQQISCPHQLKSKFSLSAWDKTISQSFSTLPISITVVYLIN